MNSATDSKTYAATDVRHALAKTCPNSTYRAVSAVDQYDAVEAYRAYDDGALESVPAALAA